MAKWKYAKEKKERQYGNYIYLENDKPKILVISHWEFMSSADGPSFKCSVSKEDGEEVDKFWYVWDFDLKEELKKRLKSKKPDVNKMEFTVTKREKDMEESFELE